MAIAFVQADGMGAGLNRGGNVTTAMSTTTGNFLVALVTQNGFHVVTSVTDTAGNTYAQAFTKQQATFNEQMDLWYAMNITGNASNVTTFNGASTPVNCEVQEWSGIALTSALDQTGTATTSGGTPSVTASGATTVANELIVGVIETVIDTVNSAGSGYSNFSADPYSNISTGIESKIVSSTGTYSADFGTGSSQNKILGIATFKAAASNIAWDAASNSGYQASLSSYSWSHTCTGTNLGLIVNVSIFATGTVSSITYNSVAMKFVRSDVIGVYRNEIWRLEAPATGSHTVAVTLSASLTSIAGADSYTNVNQTDMVEVHTGATGSTSTAPTATVTTVTDNSFVISGLTTSNGSMTVAGGQTQRNNQSGALGTGAIADKGPITPVGSSTPSWSAVGALDSWALGVVVLEPVSGTAYAQSFTGGLALSGSLVKTTQHPLSGGLALTGSITKKTNRTLTGGLVSTGVLTKQSAKGFTASLSLAGSIVKKITKGLTGTLNLTGLLTASHVYFKTFTANLNLSGSLAKKTFKNSLTGGLALAGTVSKKTIKAPFTASLGLTGFFQSLYQRFFNKRTSLNLVVPSPLILNLSVPSALVVNLTVPSALILNLVVPSAISLTVQTT